MIPQCTPLYFLDTESEWCIYLIVGWQEFPERDSRHGDWYPVFVQVDSPIKMEDHPKGMEDSSSYGVFTPQAWAYAEHVGIMSVSIEELRSIRLRAEIQNYEKQAEEAHNAVV